MNATDAAYIAGFFDGEGSITIHENAGKSPRGHAPNHTLQVSIGNTDPRVIKWIHGLYGGNFCKRTTTKENHRDVSQWILRTKGAKIFLQDILPYLRMKREQALLAIEFQNKKARRGPKRVTEEEIIEREAARVQLRLLNAKQHSLTT